MKPFPHRYDVRLTGGPSGYAQVFTNGIPSIWSAPPPEFDGPGDAWSPEHLLLASVEACFLFTFRALARASRLQFTNLEVEAFGTVDRQDGVTRFTEITLRPKLVILAGTNREHAQQLLIKTEQRCLITASLSTAVHMTPEIREAPAVA